MRILIVDDSLIIRRSIERAINTDDAHDVRMAENGLVAMAYFRDFSPDVVTMDITMPEMDGLSCVTQMLRINPLVNILVISALKDKATAIEAVKRGARGFLPKPFAAEDVADELAELLRPPRPRRKTA